MTFTFAEVVGATVVIFAMAGVEYASIIQHVDAATTALVNVVMFGAGYFLRAKLQPSTPDVGPPKPPLVPHG